MSTRLLPSNTDREAGQSLVEFALVLTFIVIPLIFTLIEASVIMYKYVALTNAAREGARTGSIYLYTGNPGSTTAVDTSRNQAIAKSLDTLGPLLLKPQDCEGSGGSSPHTTRCQVSYGSAIGLIPDPLRSTEPLTITLTHVHPFLFGALGSTIDLKAQARMRIEPSMVISP